ncbi:MAG: hypothetical protein DRP94_01445 [Candidatus Latescibacterota bacterium]|nr:MAG: hypothetical protein DRP94_01445 [Candidatus Latescibacterota bacterium]RKY74784.1 MAG: hypothetical protein DRQ14_00850 [Candidatus Latescibacterota bacterium]HDH99879.1 hypothetical protein [Bacillota bacterium]
MAHAYTPGLRVTDRALVRKRRLLPIEGEVLVDLGVQVRAEDVVARAFLPGKVQNLNVAHLLGVEPGEVRKYMTKAEGEEVSAGEVLAETKPLLKWFKRQVRSPVGGTLESISDVTGQVLLREPPEPLELKAYIDGRVVELLPGQGVVVETPSALVQGIFGIGGEATGKLHVAVEAPDKVLTAEHILPEHRDGIVVGGSLVEAEAFGKAKEVGVKGIVVGGIRDQDLKELLGYELGVAITGTEDVGFVLVVTEGFGRIDMAERTFALLKRYEGHKASISGATQIRAGVIRPEVIIPRPELNPEDIAEEEVEARGIEVGDTVRLIRAPLFGRIGKVTGLPPEPTKISTESVTRVLEVELEGGKRVIVPRANVEKMEG